MSPQPCGFLCIQIAYVLCVFSVQLFQLVLQIMKLALKIEQVPSA